MGDGLVPSFYCTSDHHGLHEPQSSSFFCIETAAVSLLYLLSSRFITTKQLRVLINRQLSHITFVQNIINFNGIYTSCSSRDRNENKNVGREGRLPACGYVSRYFLWQKTRVKHQSVFFFLSFFSFFPFECCLIFIKISTNNYR